MKEAAGEANMTVITIVLIGVVAAVGLILVPRLMRNMGRRSCCTDAAGSWTGAACTNAKGSTTYNANEYNSCVADL